MANMTTEMTFEKATAIVAEMDRVNSEDYLQILEKITPPFYEKAVELAFDFHIRRCEEMKEDAFAQFKELAKKGVPYQERISAVDHKKVAWCDEQLELLKKRRRNYKLIPLHTWLPPEDGTYIKKVTFRRYMELNLMAALEP